MCGTSFILVEERKRICIIFNEMNNLEVLTVNATLTSPISSFQPHKNETLVIFQD